MQIGVSNPNVPIFPPRVCTLVLFIINTPQAVYRGEGQGTVEVNGAGPSAMVTEVGCYAPSSRPDGQLSQHL